MVLNAHLAVILLVKKHAIVHVHPPVKIHAKINVGVDVLLHALQVVVIIVDQIALLHAVRHVM